MAAVPNSTSEAFSSSIDASQQEAYRSASTRPTSGTLILSASFILSEMLALAASTTGAALTMDALVPHGAWGSALFQLPTFETLVTFGVMMTWLMTRGHYLHRIPTMAEARDLVAGGVIAGALTLLLMAHADAARALLAGTALQWALLVPLLVGFRQLARSGLSQAGLWRINAVLVGTPAATERVSQALTADPSLGYSVVGRLRPELAADLQHPEDWPSSWCSRNCRPPKLPTERSRRWRGRACGSPLPPPPACPCTGRRRITHCGMTWPSPPARIPGRRPRGSC